MTVTLITAHALDRFIERTKTTKSRESAEAKLRQRLESAYKLQDFYWYQGGLIFCIKNNTLVTVMKPTEKWIQTILSQKSSYARRKTAQQDLKP